MHPDLINVVSSGGMKCGQCELIVKFNKQQLSDFLTENLAILNPYLPQKSENLRPHFSKSIEITKCDPIIVAPVVKMRPQPAAHPS